VFLLSYKFINATDIPSDLA